MSEFQHNGSDVSDGRPNLDIRLAAIILDLGRPQSLKSVVPKLTLPE